ncbi:GOLPH3/VPS74 family protein [Actinoplanes sp. G11-F43]|uniref:GOLPH3/VPS74 family protein n=1 Tax=Actinoplanes sp. G11-F43 TaxID=3424130 RepID=UPI003D344AD0
MALPGSLPQRVYLLAHDPAKGRVGVWTELGAMLRAAALSDLRLHGYLTDADGRAAVNGRPTVNDPVLAGLLAEIAATRPRKWQHWIGRRHRATVVAVRDQLGAGGWVRLEPYRMAGLLPVTRVTPRDPRVRKELVNRVKGTLRNPVGRVEAADAALVTIVSAGGLSLVLDRKARRDSKRRLAELSVLTGPIGPALHKSIQAAHSEAG